MSDRDEEGKFIPGNIHAWAPGTSGNPNGRPKGAKSGSAVLRKMARQLVDPKTGLSATELISAKLIAAAMDGDLKAIDLFFTRTEGKPGTRIEMPEELDWREMALMHGLPEDEVIQQAKLLIESCAGRSGSDADKEA